MTRETSVGTGGVIVDKLVEQGYVLCGMNRVLIERTLSQERYFQEHEDAAIILGEVLGRLHQKWDQGNERVATLDVVSRTVLELRDERRRSGQPNQFLEDAAPRRIIRRTVAYLAQGIFLRWF